MFDWILFGTIAFLLMLLTTFLIIVIRDHMKSKSFELQIEKSEKRSSLQKEFDQSIKERNAVTKEKQIDPKAEKIFQEKLRQSEKKTLLSPMHQPSSEDSVPTSESDTKAPETIIPFQSETASEASRPVVTEAQKKAEAILKREYGHFSHRRLVESMGLAEEEADEFVVELIHQLEAAIESLDKAIADHRYEEIEHITHGIKGAALNIGEGGVAQLLVDYNTYMKHGTERPIIEAYQKLLKETVSDLKIEYSQVA